MLTLIKPVQMGQGRRAASQVARPPERRRSGCDWQRPPAIEGCVGSSAYCRLYARECVSCYSHTIGDAGDPAVVIRVPCERSWVAVTRGRTGAWGAGFGRGRGARGAGLRPRCAPANPEPIMTAQRRARVLSLH